MKGIRRVYSRAAREKPATEALRAALNEIKAHCLPPQEPNEKTSWPSSDTLEKLHSSVLALAMLDREREPQPRWKAYEHVERRWRSFLLIPSLNALVARARKRLNEAGKSELDRLWSLATEDDAAAAQARAFLADVQRLTESRELFREKALQTIKKAIYQDDWRAAVKALELIFPDDYRAGNKVTATAIATASTVVISVEKQRELQERRARALQEIKPC